MTDRITIARTGPNTDFYLEADVIGLGIVRCYLRAVNRGSSTSRDLNSGWQAGSIDGIGEFGRHSANPFQPSGFANGATRWRDGPWDVNVGSPAGGVILRQKLYYGNDVTAHLALQPQAPTPVAIDQILPTSLRYQFTGNGDGGSAITGWQAQISTHPSFGSPWWVGTVGSSGTTTFTDLTPGMTYYVRSRGGNAVGWGPWSAALSAETLAGGRAWDGTAFRNCKVRTWDGTNWRLVRVRTWDGSTWRNTR